MKVVIGKSDHVHLIFHDAKDYTDRASQIVDIPESLITSYRDTRREFRKLQERIRRMAQDQGVDLGREVLG